MTERAYHHGNLRSALLRRAEITVRERGVQALSLRELARDAGVSHGAPRRHFRDRAALLDAVARSGFERLARELDAAVRAADAGAQPRLLALALAYVGFAIRDAALLELMFATKHRAGAESSCPGDPEQITQFVFATMHGLATMANGGMLGDDNVDDVVADAIERLLAGLRPR